MKMKKQLILLITGALTIPVVAQETNEFKKRGEGYGPGRKNRDRAERPEFKKHSDRSGWTEERREEHQERKYKFMEKSLTDIGVSEEDRIKIRALQDGHRAKMKANMERTNAARQKLSELQNSSVTEAELDAAIDEVTQAQGEQLKILVRNRMEMERILGKEKSAKLMESARTQFRQHGRRGGSGMPPRPGNPPLPRNKKGDKSPPLPKNQPEQAIPAPPEK
jgi:hypothetical protein